MHLYVACRTTVNSQSSFSFCTVSLHAFSKIMIFFFTHPGQEQEFSFAICFVIFFVYEFCLNILSTNVSSYCDGVKF